MQRKFTNQLRQTPIPTLEVMSVIVHFQCHPQSTPYMFQAEVAFASSELLSMRLILKMDWLVLELLHYVSYFSSRMIFSA